MRMNLAWRAMALLILLLGWVGTRSAYADSIDAIGLVGDMNKGVALVEKSLQGAGVKPDNTKKKAFFTALRSTTLAVERMSRAMKAKSAAFLSEIDEATRNIERLHIAYEASGLSIPVIASTLEKMREASRVLQKSYGVASARLRQGGALTRAEEESYAKMRARVETLRSRIKDMRARSPKVVRDPSFGQSLASILLLLDAFDTRQLTLTRYVQALQCYRYAYDIWWANTSYWGYYYPWSASLYTIAGPIWIECGTSYQSIVESASYTVTDWTYLEHSVELQESVHIDISDAEVSRYQTEALEFHDDAKIDPMLKDTDHDGIPDVKDSDMDNDGIPNHKDVDANNDGIPDVEMDAVGGASTGGSGPAHHDSPIDVGPNPHNDDRDDGFDWGHHDGQDDRFDGGHGMDTPDMSMPDSGGDGD